MFKLVGWSKNSERLLLKKQNIISGWCCHHKITTIKLNGCSAVYGSCRLNSLYSELPWFQASSKGWMLHTKQTLAVWYMFHKVIWCVTFQRSLDDLSFKIHLVEFITLKSALALGGVREFLSLKQNFSIQSPVHKCGIVSKASVV